MSATAACEGCGKPITVIRFGTSAPTVSAACGPTFEPPTVETDPSLPLVEEWKP